MYEKTNFTYMTQENREKFILFFPKNTKKSLSVANNIVILHTHRSYESKSPSNYDLP